MNFRVDTRTDEDGTMYHEVRTPLGGHYQGVDDELVELIEIAAGDERRHADELRSAQEIVARFISYCQQMEAERTAQLQIEEAQFVRILQRDEHDSVIEVLMTEDELDSLLAFRTTP